MVTKKNTVELPTSAKCPDCHTETEVNRNLFLVIYASVMSIAFGIIVFSQLFIIGVPEPEEFWAATMFALLFVLFCILTVWSFHRTMKRKEGKCEKCGAKIRVEIKDDAEYVSVWDRLGVEKSKKQKLLEGKASIVITACCETDDLISSTLKRALEIKVLKKGIRINWITNIESASINITIPVIKRGSHLARYLSMGMVGAAVLKVTGHIKLNNGKIEPLTVEIGGFDGTAFSDSESVLKTKAQITGTEIAKKILKLHKASLLQTKLQI